MINPEDFKEELKMIWHELSCLSSQMVYIKNLLEDLHKLKGGTKNGN